MNDARRYRMTRRSAYRQPNDADQQCQAAGTSFVRVGLVGTRAADAVADSTIGRLVAG
jgi:hypothetical protein